MPPETPTELLSRENSNVEALKRLLIDHLPSDDLSDLLDHLRSAGAAGSDDGILCEYCLSANPIELLSQEFSKQRLLRAAQSLGVATSASTDISTVAKALLRHLQFHIVEDPKGLPQMMEHVSLLQAKLEHVHDRDSIVGVVTPLSTELERILHGLIVFYGTVFYGAAYKESFAGWSDEFGRSKLTLGTKCNLLRKLEEEVQSDAMRNAKLRDMFSGREFVVGTQAIDSLGEFMPERGDFSHFKDHMDGLSLSQCRTRVQDMIAKTMTFLRHLESSGVFPTIIIVLEYVEDRFGRKYVMCVDEKGRVEKVFADRPIDPTKHYFLHPLTNPVRIYPQLIEYLPAE